MANIEDKTLEELLCLCLELRNELLHRHETVTIQECMNNSGFYVGFAHGYDSWGNPRWGEIRGSGENCKEAMIDFFKKLMELKDRVEQKQKEQYEELKKKFLDTPY